MPDAHYPDYMEVWRGGGASLSFGASLQKLPNHSSKTTVVMNPGAGRLYSLSLKMFFVYFFFFQLTQRKQFRPVEMTGNIQLVACTARKGCHSCKFRFERVEGVKTIFENIASLLLKIPKHAVGLDGAQRLFF